MRTRRAEPWWHGCALALVLTCAACAPRLQDATDDGASDQWVLVGRTADLTFRIDTSRLGSDAYLTIWFRFDYSSDQTLSSGTRYRAVELREEVECRRRLTRPREMTMMDLSGQPVGADVFSREDFIAFEQHLMTARYHDLACGALNALGRLPPPSASTAEKFSAPDSS